MLDLRRVLLPPEQAAGDVVHEGVAEGGPVAAREGDAVGVEAARRAAELRRMRALFQLVHAGLQARREDGKFFADARFAFCSLSFGCVFYFLFFHFIFSKKTQKKRQFFPSCSHLIQHLIISSSGLDED